jgi:hypothetical protein
MRQGVVIVEEFIPKYAAETVDETSLMRLDSTSSEALSEPAVKEMLSARFIFISGSMSTDGQAAVVVVTFRRCVVWNGVPKLGVAGESPLGKEVCIL